jgi:hypothetical protein
VGGGAGFTFQELDGRGVSCVNGLSGNAVLAFARMPPLYPADPPASGAAVGEFAPVEVDVGEEEVADRDEEKIEREGGLGHVEVGGDGVGNPGEDEVESEDVGADHPLTVGDELAVAGGEEGGERAQEPDRRQDGVGEGHSLAESSEAEVEGYGSGEGDAADVDAAHDAVELEVVLAEMGRELERAEDDCQDAGDRVGDEEEAVGDELFGEAVGMRDDWVLGEDEHGDAGEAEDGPDGGLGEVFAASGWGRGHGGGRHRCDPISGGQDVGRGPE